MMPRPSPALPAAGAELPARSPATQTYCFAVHAAADPGVLPRVMALFAKRGLVPSRWHSDLTRRADAGGELVIDIQVDGLAPDEGAYIAACLGQQVAVDGVLTSVKSGLVPDAQPRPL